MSTVTPVRRARSASSSATASLMRILIMTSARFKQRRPSRCSALQVSATKSPRTAPPIQGVVVEYSGPVRLGGSGRATTQVRSPGLPPFYPASWVLALSGACGSQRTIAATEVFIDGWNQRCELSYGQDRRRNPRQSQTRQETSNTTLATQTWRFRSHSEGRSTPLGGRRVAQRRLPLRSCRTSRTCPAGTSGVPCLFRQVASRTEPATPQPVPVQTPQLRPPDRARHRRWTTSKPRRWSRSPGEGPDRAPRSGAFRSPELPPPLETPPDPNSARPSLVNTERMARHFR